MRVKFLSYLVQWLFIVSTISGVSVHSAMNEQITNDCLYKFTEEYCSESQENFTKALEKCKNYASLLARGCIHAGLRKGFKIPDSLKEQYPLLGETLKMGLSDIEALKPKKKKKEDGNAQQSIAKENLIARCRAVRQRITLLLTKKGVNPASDPLMIQVEKLLAGLVDAPQVDALLLLQAGQCEGIGEAAALLPDSPGSSGMEAPCLRPPSPRRTPLINDDQPTNLAKETMSQGKAVAPSSFVPKDSPDTIDKTPSTELDKIHSTGGIYASGQLPSKNDKDKDLLPE